MAAQFSTLELASLANALRKWQAQQAERELAAQRAQAAFGTQTQTEPIKFEFEKPVGAGLL